MIDETSIKWIGGHTAYGIKFGGAHAQGAVALVQWGCLKCLNFIFFSAYSKRTGQAESFDPLDFFLRPVEAEIKIRVL